MHHEYVQGASPQGQIINIKKHQKHRTSFLIKTLPKTLFEAIKEGADQNNKLLSSYIKTGKYLILPAFYKLLLTLKKNKR